jgi:adenylate kinase
MVLLFLGPSGSGKDTQANLLVDEFDYERISSGDLVRQISEGENEIQKIIRKSMNKGFLADNFIFGLLQIYIYNTINENIILSGVVRRVSQIELLDFTLFKDKKRLDKVVYFDLNDDEAIRRMSGRLRCMDCLTNFHTLYNPPKVENICDICGGKLTRREDDAPEAIQKRLDDFHKDNEEILTEYEKRGILIKLDASKGIIDIYEELKKRLKE